MSNNLEEYWVLHKPRHPIFGTIMNSVVGVAKTTNPVPSTNTTVYTGNENDCLFYKYTSTGNTVYYFAAVECPWMTGSKFHTMQEAIVSAKRLISFVGQDNVRIAKIVNSTMNIEF